MKLKICIFFGLGKKKHTPQRARAQQTEKACTDILFSSSFFLLVAALLPYGLFCTHFAPVYTEYTGVCV